jgi:hypothetical protein
VRPTPIPDAEVFEGGKRMVIAGPDGDLTGDIRPVEAILSAFEGVPAFSLRIALEPGDLERLQSHGVFWLTVAGRQLQPFSLHVPDEVP